MAHCLTCHQATTGRLCPPCADRLGQRLADLPHMVTALGAYLRPSSQVPDRLGTHSASPDAPLPVVEAVLDLVGPGGIVTVLETWRQALAEDMGERWPAPWGDLDGRARRAAAALHTRLGYIRLDWPAAGDLAREVEQLHGAASRHLAPTERPTVVGHHPAEPGGEPCGGRLELPYGGGDVRCARCRATWGPLQWLTLRRAIEAARTAADQAA
ncbi:hypothetical protein ACFVZ3_22075 [Kitasatospora purpeofusca]|uniref:hypothetical protein n=1 Tax=Kitasatospora purpeofusca TaxID=67352 RepID=UPI0036CBDB7A